MPPTTYLRMIWIVVALCNLFDIGIKSLHWHNVRLFILVIGQCMRLVVWGSYKVSISIPLVWSVFYGCSRWLCPLERLYLWRLDLHPCYLSIYGRCKLLIKIGFGRGEVMCWQSAGVRRYRPGHACSLNAGGSCGSTRTPKVSDRRFSMPNPVCLDDPNIVQGFCEV